MKGNNSSLLALTAIIRRGSDGLHGLDIGIKEVVALDLLCLG